MSICTHWKKWRWKRICVYFEKWEYDVYFGEGHLSVAGCFSTGLFCSCYVDNRVFWFATLATGLFSPTQASSHHSHSQTNQLIFTTTSQWLTVHNSSLQTQALLSFCPPFPHPDRLTCCRACQSRFLPPASPWVTSAPHVFPFSRMTFCKKRHLGFEVLLKLFWVSWGVFFPPCEKRRFRFGLLWEFVHRSLKTLWLEHSPFRPWQ